MAKKFKDRLRKHKTGPKSGFDRNWRIFEQFWANLGQFGSIWAILSPLESLESLQNSTKIQPLVKKLKVGLKRPKNGPKSETDENSGFFEQFWANLGNFESNGKF